MIKICTADHWESEQVNKIYHHCLSKLLLSLALKKKRIHLKAIMLEREREYHFTKYCSVVMVYTVYVLYTV